MKYPPSKSQLKQSSPGTSVSDYWYKSYSTGTDNKTPSQSLHQPLETKVVGVTFDGRQSIITLLEVGEMVLLVREPDNPYDSNAIRVNRINGQCLGFINRQLAARLAPELDKYCQPVKATVASLTGGYYPGSSLGVSIQFTIPN